MNIRREALALEGRVVAAGLQLGPILKTAGVTRESWRTWKSGRGMPQMRKWEAVKQAIQDATLPLQNDSDLAIPPKPNGDMV